MTGGVHSDHPARLGFDCLALLVVRFPPNIWGGGPCAERAN